MEELREQIRLAEGRDPQPSAGVIDIVRKPAWQRGFEVHSKRWVDEPWPG
ncbi:hypothetical protein [Winogradskya humida]|uniref:Uncharacterized protein n=1 Tax=Winogradskya humida TaxID=113566 RepID=A0ABQ3ZVX5_9ACTN|nr:hypothetical protein [Actinoplanes humidus]GIE22598.1 hypothetical protein Ahu01nite_057000 [Actinoplanes humidus]